MLTPEELIGLMGNLLKTDSPPAGETRLSEWVAAHKETLGAEYANELGKHYEEELSRP